MNTKMLTIFLNCILNWNIQWVVVFFLPYCNIMVRFTIARIFDLIKNSNLSQVKIRTIWSCNLIKFNIYLWKKLLAKEKQIFFKIWRVSYKIQWTSYWKVKCISFQFENKTRMTALNISTYFCVDSPNQYI